MNKMLVVSLFLPSAFSCKNSSENTRKWTSKTQINWTQPPKPSSRKTATQGNGGKKWSFIKSIPFFQGLER